jgi:DNA-binding transcriptional MerR regulator
MQIGDLSRDAGVHIETIRYYERIGLLPAPARRPNGRRSYAEADARRLRFIRHARSLDFDIPAIRRLLSLQDNPEAPCGVATDIVTEQLAAVEERIAHLLHFRDELARMAKDCGQNRVADCRIIETLSR